MLFLPPQSSTLNPIEQVWSIFKREWSVRLLKATDYTKRLSMDEAKEPLWEVLDGLSGPSMRSLASGAHQTMLLALEGNLA